MKKAVLFRVKKERVDEWKLWCSTIATTLYTEAQKSLEEEKVFQELTLLFELKGEFYGVGYMDGDGLPANMNREINQKHKEMKKICIEYVTDAQVLYEVNLFQKKP